MQRDIKIDRFNLSGKVVLISGASRGIGRAIALEFESAKAKVVGVSRTPASHAAMNALTAYKSIDISDHEKFQEMLDWIKKSLGSLDVYVHCAGVSQSHNGDDEQERFSQTVDFNLKQAFHCVSSAAKAMDEDRGGAIVLVSSINSILGFPGNPGYVASKGGVSALTRALAIDFAQRNVRVNSIAPGYIKTEMTAKSFNDPKENQKRLNRMVLNRWGEPGDIAGPALFLASDASAYITGHELVVDGGWTIKGI